MSRLVGLLVLAIALLQGTGLDVRLGEMACAGQHHEDEGAAAECPPECATCPCCVRVVFPPLAVATPFGEPRAEGVFFDDLASCRLPAPPPRGILHVPRLTA